jgi:hypothetical protein
MEGKQRQSAVNTLHSVLPNFYVFFSFPFFLFYICFFLFFTVVPEVLESSFFFRLEYRTSQHQKHYTDYQNISFVNTVFSLSLYFFFCLSLFISNVLPFSVLWVPLSERLLVPQKDSNLHYVQPPTNAVPRNAVSKFTNSTAKYFIVRAQLFLSNFPCFSFCSK